MKSVLAALFLVLAFAKADAQGTDLFRAEYTYFPQRKSDNSFRRFRTFANIPLKVGEGTYFVPFIEYRNVHMVIRDTERFQEFSTDRYESYEIALGYTQPLKNNWRFGSRAGVLIASDFDEAKPVKDDYFVSASAYFIKNEKKRDDGGKPWQLVVGVQYSTTVGRPFPLPYLNYYREFKKDWSFTLGAPKMNLRYRFDDKNSVQLYARLDGFYANIQNDVDTNGGIGDNISMTTAMAGPGYQYNFTKHISVYVYAGYTFLNEIRLRNTDGDDVKIINETNTFYSRAGIKFKI
ncbi:hypothetical protein BST97_07840 [Nonlabens spongiae]|uniref:DUF6268 domain-containing protein n=1 Tax=Nonlabens spongiae TaxID=331648 RepID=A0A1W6MJY4_9FLAO|nr:DUF6268 family outer membrane beta-barrel protein [Nonlabens spongiae]ARN77915.1 hypothetical protein BST97_07840 [Nonlabens spongiae]